MIQDNNKAEAERRRDAGMDRVAASHPDRVTLGRIAMLSALLGSPDNTGTIDDATCDDAIRCKYADGGKWRGTVTRSLAKDELIEKVDAVESRRTSRHCGYITRWRLTGPKKARRFVEVQYSAIKSYQEKGAAANE